MKILTHIAEGVIRGTVRLYKALLSPILPRSCRYYPTCSEYMLKAVEKNGPFLGFLQGVARIVRCNPLSPGGVDYPGKIRLRMAEWLKEH